MRIRNILILAGCGFALTAMSARAQETQKPKFNALKGPATAQLGNVAQIKVPAGFEFIDAKDTQALLKRSGEPVSGNEMGLIVSTNQPWSVIFEFDDIGYVKDDEKDKLNADKLLQAIKEGTKEANKERIRAGSAPLEIVGWEKPPEYDPVTHNLEWAIRATSEGQPLLNYNTRILGRKGVMEVVLIVAPDKLAATLPTFNKLLAGYSYQSGQTYAEYRPGDKIAKYGLAALVVGGAAVGAAKLGLLGPVILLFKKAWKLVVIAVAAVAAFFKKLFARLFRSKSRET